MTVGDRIKNKRKFFSLSQTELAERISISKQTLYKYENNIITNIPSDKIKELARVLEVTPGYLMGWDENEKPTATEDDELVELMTILEQLTDSERELVFKMIRSLTEKNKRNQ